MALPQLPAHVVHKLGQHSRVIQEFLSTSEYAKESRPFRSALFVHTFYPLFNVHSADFFSNNLFFQGPLTRWGRNSKGRSLRSRDLATFDCHCLFYLIILRPSVATSALADVSFALFVHYGLSAPFGSMEWHCLSISFSFPPVIPSHKTPRDDREITER